MHKDATRAEAGIVIIHAQTIRAAMPHFMPESFVVAPTPTIDPAMVWVVETGMPAWVAKKRVKAPAASAQKPPTGLSLVIFMPIVLTIRQPPNAVPKAIARWQDKYDP